MKTIPLTNGQSTIVDDEDYSTLSQHIWTCSNGYPITTWHYEHPILGRIRTVMSMHRILMQCLPNDGKMIDHINRNPLDNRKNNLRFVDRSTNIKNSDYYDNGLAYKRQPPQKISQFHGVNFQKGRSAPWRVFIPANGKRRLLGSFHSERDAAIAWNAEVTKRSLPYPLNHV